jgi:hypothetical protein
MINDSLQLAQLWIELKRVKDTLDNTVIPVSGHLGLDDTELMIAMENLSEKIESHFHRFKLAAHPDKTNPLH